MEDAFEKVCHFIKKFSAETTKKSKFLIQLWETVCMVTSIFLPFNDMFFDEIIHVQSLTALSMYDHSPANVLKERIEML